MPHGKVVMNSEAKIRQILERITDPEIPVLSVVDLGIIREIIPMPAGWEIKISPTYSGCPAMNLIAMQIKMELASEGFAPVMVTEVLSPAWTTDWMSDHGKRKLEDYGIAPPVNEKRVKTMLFGKKPVVPCPRCGSKETALISEFGSTACKSLMRCLSCLEPFDYFKCHR